MSLNNDIPVKLTPQRQMVLDVLKDSKDHPSADDVFTKVKNVYSGISFKTVYNTLELFRDNGIIQELIIDAKKKRFCPDPRPHNHIICSGCKRVVDVFFEVPANLPDALTHGFKIDGFSVVYHGLCPECSKKD
ncbi:Fur family transcriptional regulator [Nitrospirota bacterium]